MYDVDARLLGIEARVRDADARLRAAEARMKNQQDSANKGMVMIFSKNISCPSTKNRETTVLILCGEVG